MFEQTKGIVYVRIPGHDKREPIEVDVYQPLDDVRDALKRFTQFAFDGNFRLKDSHAILDSSKSLRDLGLDCGVGQYVELEYHHSNYFPGLLGGVSKKNKAAVILRSGIERPPGDLRTLDEKVFESLYQQAQAELAKEQTARPRRASTTGQSEETKEKEDVEMLEVAHIKLGVAKDEKRLKAEVEKLLGKALEAWTCAKIKFHNAFVDLHAIDATPARSMAWWCRSLAVRDLAGTAVRRRYLHPTHWLISTQAGERLKPKDIRDALDADKTLQFSTTKAVGPRLEPPINKLLVKWGREFYERGEKNPKSVEGDAFEALDLEDYIRSETSSTEYKACVAEGCKKFKELQALLEKHKAYSTVWKSNFAGLLTAES